VVSILQPEELVPHDIVVEDRVALNLTNHLPLGVVGDDRPYDHSVLAAIER
jgi:hypothetical protein